MMGTAAICGIAFPTPNNRSIPVISFRFPPKAVKRISPQKLKGAGSARMERAGRWSGSAKQITI
jgi:hypothetical protein